MRFYKVAPTYTSLSRRQFLLLTLDMKSNRLALEPGLALVICFRSDVLKLLWLGRMGPHAAFIGISWNAYPLGSLKGPLPYYEKIKPHGAVLSESMGP